jgi:hypothetical protein
LKENENVSGLIFIVFVYPVNVNGFGGAITDELKEYLDLKYNDPTDCCDVILDAVSGAQGGTSEQYTGHNCSLHDEAMLLKVLNDGKIFWPK